MSELVMDMPAALISYPRSRAVGREAQEIKRQEIKIEKAMLEPPGSGGKLRAAIIALASAFYECNSQDWDGHGAAPASFESVRYAILLLKEVVSVAREIPDVSIHPDGEVALEWYRDPRRVFSVSVGLHGELTYAGTYSGSKVHGVEAHVGEGLPREIYEGIRRVYTCR
jgi:hypothetical protein